MYEARPETSTSTSRGWLGNMWEPNREKMPFCLDAIYEHLPWLPTWFARSFHSRLCQRDGRIVWMSRVWTQQGTRLPFVESLSDVSMVSKLSCWKFLRWRLYEKIMVPSRRTKILRIRKTILNYGGCSSHDRKIHIIKAKDESLYNKYKNIFLLKLALFSSILCY